MSELLQRVRACTPEEKAELISELALDIFATRGAKGYAIQDRSQQTIGFLTPGTVHPAALIPDDPAWRAEIQRRADNPGKTISLDEFLDGITVEQPEGR